MFVFGSAPRGKSDHDPGEVPVTASTPTMLAERFYRLVSLRRIADPRKAMAVGKEGAEARLRGPVSQNSLLHDQVSSQGLNHGKA